MTLLRDFLDPFDVEITARMPEALALALAKLCEEAIATRPNHDDAYLRIAAATLVAEALQRNGITYTPPPPRLPPSVRSPNRRPRYRAKERALGLR